MAVSNVIKNFRDGSLVISDGTGTPITLTVSFDEGNFTVNNLKSTLAETVAYETRGQLRSVRHTTILLPTGSFSVMFNQFSEATVGTVCDAILKNGAFSSAVSVDGANAEVMKYDLAFTVAGTVHGDASDHTFGATSCELVLDSFSEGDPNTVSVSFTCYGQLTGDLAASR